MSTKAVVVAIIVGALIIGAAIIVAAALNRSNTARFETESAQEAWEHQAAGWYCEMLSGDEYGPITTEVLEVFARAENEVDGPLFGEGSAEPEFVCTRAGS